MKEARCRLEGGEYKKCRNPSTSVHGDTGEDTALLTSPVMGNRVKFSKPLNGRVTPGGWNT